jgi:hypothetical protein
VQDECWAVTWLAWRRRSAARRLDSPGGCNMKWVKLDKTWDII